MLAFCVQFNSSDLRFERITSLLRQLNFVMEKKFFFSFLKLKEAYFTYSGCNN